MSIIDSMKIYQPKDIETKWYKHWEDKNQFSPDIQQGKETYAIVIPPPNVTGSLHIGHALVNTLQDILIRWKRMCGFKTLWLPGTDHAGIATQMVVERELATNGIQREKLGREKFVAEVWKWKELYGNKIFKQLKRIGASLDWSRERFTLDEGLSKAVRKTFVDLYREGLIYRGEYLVNWCPNDKTALSDLEVDHIDIEGEITQIAYPFEDGSGFIEVATTRPETLLGDTAVAVHPEDPRYKDKIGKSLLVPLVNRVVPLIAAEYCDMNFGSGAVKVTPAHDQNDFAMGQRHDLPTISIFNKDATLNHVFPELEGQDRFEVRKNVIALLKEKKLWRSTKKHTHSVGHCQRCKTLVEPRLSIQWFCKMKEMAAVSLQAVQDKKIKFVPENQERILHEWLSNIQDWCISRQLWWGHQIPAWYCNACNETIVSETTPVTCIFCKSKDLTPESDVLDTWFSSGIFPFSTMGWPEETKDLKDFYPNSTLITGYDILFFWVGRMVMMGLNLTGEVPFPEVFLHGLVRDAKGEKMSKTKGNVIDPLDIIEKFGADAMRYTLCALTVMGRDIKLPEKAIESNRNFINKFWNASKFTLYHVDRLGIPKRIHAIKPGIFDLWILSKLQETTTQANKYLQTYRFNEVAKCLYSFVWHEFCDWYLEMIKSILFGKLGEEAESASLSVLCHVLDASMRLLHPILPFVTEEIWHELPWTSGDIILAAYPQADKTGFTSPPQAEELIELTNVIRNIRGENNIKPAAKIKIMLVTKDKAFRKAIQQMELVIQSLTNVEEMNLKDQFNKQEGYAGSVGKGFEVFVDLRENIDVDQEKNRLQKEREKSRKRKSEIQGKLTNPNFINKAPKLVVEKNQKELRELENKILKIEENLSTLGV